MNCLKWIGLGIVILFAVLMLIFLFRKNDSFFNIRQTIKEHLCLFKNCKIQYIIFYIFPLFFAVGLSLIYQASQSLYSGVSVILGIILSMLLGILSILAGQDFASVQDENQKQRAKMVAKETINSIVFNSMLCILLLLYSLIMTEVVSQEINFILNCVLSSIFYYIFIVILFTLFLIVKHMSRLIEFNLKVKKHKDNQ